MKKFVYVLGIMMLTLILVGCGENKNIEGSLEDIMTKLYAGIGEDEMPMMVENISLGDENFINFAFAEVDYKEAIASESMVGSVAHSVVLIRLKDSKDADKVVKEIDEKADTRKWVCVEAENKYVLSKGDLVVLIMSNDLAPKIKENFENLK